MESLLDFALEERYKRVVELGDKVAEFDTLIQWDRFRPIIGDLYTNATEQGGRPNFDEILMIKLLVLQSMYGLSDPELERQANDKISFLKFLGFPEKIPDQSTIWYFRERLIKHKKLDLIWQELQRQENVLGLKIKKGTIQDATFITADPGHAPADKPRGDQAKTRRSKEGTWTKKNSKSYFGFKTHTKEDCDYGLIWEIQTSTASLHDSQIDLSKKGEVVYRDKGYFGVKPLGFDATMKRGVRNHPIGIWDKLRNKRISRKRSPGERPYAVIKTVFKSAHTMVTTIARVHAKMIFAAMSFNIGLLRTFKHRGII
ncbi:MAG: IS5 family transposase [Methanoregula sp.]|jgi:IS5 family transposase|nr:IS5 family transposase [Methanoregula sp.]